MLHAARERYQRAADALAEAHAAYRALLEQEQRRQAFANFQHGDCNWCGRQGRTATVVAKGVPTGEHICPDCRHSHAILQPPTKSAI